MTSHTKLPSANKFGKFLTKTYVRLQCSFQIGFSWTRKITHSQEERLTRQRDIWPKSSAKSKGLSFKVRKGNWPSFFISPHNCLNDYLLAKDNSNYVDWVCNYQKYMATTISKMLWSAARLVPAQEELQKYAGACTLHLNF